MALRFFSKLVWRRRSNCLFFFGNFAVILYISEQSSYDFEQFNPPVLWRITRTHARGRQALNPLWAQGGCAIKISIQTICENRMNMLEAAQNVNSNINPNLRGADTFRG
jgi:hypothetical protein